jgi:hypothetical protein
MGEFYMKIKIISILVLTCFEITLLWSATSSVMENREINKILTLKNPAERTVLVVDIINGSISIIGNSENQVEVKAFEYLRAKDDSGMEKAKEEIKLDISQDDTQILVYMDGPFRSKSSRESINFQGWGVYGYEVSYDVEIKVPFNIGLELKTINDGDIQVEDCAGKFNIENINGNIRLSGMSGNGRAYALNGKMLADFAKNPAAECYFGSLNGDVEVYFPKNFAADIRLKTFNGDVYSDFEVKNFPDLTTHKIENRGRKKIYKINRSKGVRVGVGGPEIELDAFNGDILIRDRINLNQKNN